MLSTGPNVFALIGQVCDPVIVSNLPSVCFWRRFHRSTVALLGSLWFEKYLTALQRIQKNVLNQCFPLSPSLPLLLRSYVREVASEGFSSPFLFFFCTLFEINFSLQSAGLYSLITVQLHPLNVHQYHVGKLQ